MNKNYAALLLALALALGAAACQKKETGENLYTAGTYTASAQGYGGEVTVEITVDDSEITGVKISGDRETPNVGGAALPELGKQIKEKGADIDGIAGATLTSNGAKAAAAECIAKAKGESGKMAGV